MDKNNRRRVVLNFAMQAGDVTRGDVMKLTGLSRSVSWALLKESTVKGFLERMGEYDKTIYLITEKGAVFLDIMEKAEKAGIEL